MGKQKKTTEEKKGWISKQTAEELRHNYEVSEKAIGRELRKEPSNHGKELIKGYVISKEEIEKLLNTKDSVAIRLYHGLNKNGGKELLVYPVKSDGKDCEDLIFSIYKKCPPYCYVISPPNGGFDLDDPLIFPREDFPANGLLEG